MRGTLPRATRRDPEEDFFMMPLVFAPEGEEMVIKKIGGSPDVRQHLADIGFNVGSTVTVITTLSGNVIVRVKEARIAISREMAQKIMV